MSSMVAIRSTFDGTNKNSCSFYLTLKSPLLSNSMVIQTHEMKRAHSPVFLLLARCEQERKALMYVSMQYNTNTNVPVFLKGKRVVWFTYNNEA